LGGVWMDCGVWFGVFAGKPRSYESHVVRL
jgi:hypothetical protein